MNHAIPFRIVDVTADRSDWVEQTAALLHTAFRHRSEDWQNLDSARREVVASLQEGLEATTRTARPISAVRTYMRTFQAQFVTSEIFEVTHTSFISKLVSGLSA